MAQYDSLFGDESGTLDTHSKTGGINPTEGPVLPMLTLVIESGTRYALQKPKVFKTPNSYPRGRGGGGGGGGGGGCIRDPPDD